MKIAFLILAHKNPKQLEKLLTALQHPAFDFFIHVDKKSDIKPFLYLSNNKKKIFFIQKRTKIYWAGFGTIQATINGFEEILPANIYDYINVISAQDFPLKPASYIYDYILKRNGTEFITCESMHSEGWNVAPRVTNYHFVNWKIPGKYKLENLANKILPKRKFPMQYEIVGRANWFTLTTNAIKYCMDVLKKHPEIIRYFKYCWGADEFIFSSILYNSSFKNKIEDNLVYVDWGEGEHEGHPKLLTVDDYDKLILTTKLFARKFDAERDCVILDMLEKNIKQDKLLTK